MAQTTVQGNNKMDQPAVMMTDLISLQGKPAWVVGGPEYAELHHNHQDALNALARLFKETWGYNF